MLLVHPPLMLRCARQLDPSATIADRNYVGLVHVDPDAITLEAAMGVADVVEETIRGIAQPVSGHRGMKPRRRNKADVTVV